MINHHGLDCCTIHGNLGPKYCHSIRKKVLQVIQQTALAIGEIKETKNGGRRKQRNVNNSRIRMATLIMKNHYSTYTMCIYIYNYIVNMLHNIIEKVVKFGTGPHELPDKLLLALLAVAQSSSNPPGRGMKHV